MRDSIIVALTLVLGILLGIFGRAYIPGDISVITKYLLYLLLFCAGISIGGDSELINKLRNTHPIFLLLPLATIVGTLMGSALSGVFLPHRTTTECMAVGSGFAYYSLSSILISQLKGVDLGVVSLLSNVIREVFVLLFAVPLATYFGKTTPISCAGATSMDSTLPFIVKASGSEFIVIALVHGILVDFSVPFLVTFFCSF